MTCPLADLCDRIQQNERVQHSHDDGREIYILRPRVPQERYNEARNTPLAPGDSTVLTYLRARKPRPLIAGFASSLVEKKKSDRNAASL